MSTPTHAGWWWWRPSAINPWEAIFVADAQEAGLLAHFGDTNWLPAQKVAGEWGPEALPPDAPRCGDRGFALPGVGSGCVLPRGHDGAHEYRTVYPQETIARLEQARKEAVEVLQDAKECMYSCEDCRKRIQDWLRKWEAAP